VTRPSEIRIKEGEAAGTRGAQYEVGADLGELRFTITPEVVQEYMRVVDADPSLYVVAGRPAAPPHILCPFLMPVMYQRYPPIQGIIQADVTWSWHHPIYADEATEMVVTGRVIERYERNGRWFVRWTAEYRRADGTPVATATNRICVPE
jgi:hypothetical protein